MSAQDRDQPDPTTARPLPRRSRLRVAIHGLRGVLLGTGEPAPPASTKPTWQGQKQLTGKLAGLSLHRQVWVLSLWPLLEQLLNFLVGTVDLAIAGRLTGDASRVAAIDAISVASYFVWLMTILQAAVGVGASAIVSRAIGASHRRLANAGAGQALVLAVGAGVIAGAGVYLIAPWIAVLLGLKGEAAGMAVQYIRITALSIPMCGALFAGGAVLRAAGDTRNPFFAMLVVNLINITASIALAGVSLSPDDALTSFIRDIFFPDAGDRPIAIGLGWGVAGVAWGTTIAWTVGGLIVFVYLLSGKAEIRVRRHRLIPHAHTIRRIVRIALPNLGSQLGFWGVNFALLYYVSLLDQEGAYGAHTIAMRIESVAFLPGFAIAVAASTLTGQYLGLGDPDRARQATYLSLKAAVGLMTAFAVFFFFTADGLVVLLSPGTPVHADLAPTLLRIGSVSLPLLAACIIYGSAIQGAGDTKAVTIINFSMLLTVRLVGAYVLTIPMGLGLKGVWIAMGADLILRGIVFAVYYRTGRWANARV